MRYCRACAHYSDFLDRPQQITQKLPKQGYVAPRLRSLLQILYGLCFVDRRLSLSSITDKTWTEHDYIYIYIYIYIYYTAGVL
jgi:hypothetical protein